MKIKSEIWRYVFLTLFVLATRLPFLSNGYGLDPDAWSVAITANHIHTTGEYEASRLPGYPVHELLCSLLINYGPAGLNLISAIFSVISVLFFALILKLLRFKQVFLASAALAFVPVLFIQSTTTIDYMISLGFIMAGMYFLLRNKLFLAGALIGFAIGSRISAGVMLIPLSILLVENDGVEKNVRRILKFVLPALCTGLILFIPVINTYGLGFFTFYNVPYPSIAKVLYKFSIEVWGLIGFLGLIISTGLLFLPDRITERKFLFPRSVNEKFVISWLVAIDLYIIAFLKLPVESGYLIPIIPFVIFIFGKYLYNKAFVFLCLMLILSSLICTISPTERFDAVTPSAASMQFNAAGEKLYFDVFKGPVMSYKTRRENGVLFVNNLLESTDTLKTKSVLVTGKWYNQMIVQCADTGSLKVKVKDYLNEEEALYYYAKGYSIYFLPKQDVYNKIMRNVDLDVYHAVPYFLGEKY